MEFTGERLVVGKVGRDLWAEHHSRYLLVEELARGKRVLDLGAGAGYGAAHLSRTARSVMAIDISAEAIHHARREHPGNSVHHVVGDVSALPFATAAFDLVVAFEVLEHVPDQAGLVAEVRRVLGRDGVFVVSTPNKAYYTDERGEKNPFHLHEFLVDELEEFLRRTFPSVSILMQNHAPAVVIAPPGDETGAANGHPGVRMVRTEGEPRAVAYRTGHYAIAVCSESQTPLPQLVYLPEKEGNILRQREGALRELHAERERVVGLYHEQIQRVREQAQQQEENRKTIDQLRREQAALLEHIEQLREEIERRRLGRSLATKIASFLAAGAAVPAAAAIGVAAGALELGARLLPLKPRFGQAHLEGQASWVEGKDLPALRPLDVEPDPAATGLPLCTIAVLSYEARDLLERYLPSVRDAVVRSGQPHEILVVDNGSTDGSVEMLRERFPEVRVLSLARNYFFAAGNNAAARVAKHDILVFLNNDMRVDPEFLNPLLRPFRDPANDVFAVSSQIFLTDPLKRRVETGMTRGQFRRGMLQVRHDVPPSDLDAGTVPVLYGGGGSCAFDRRKFRELGGFDLLYHPFYCEDADLSWRAWQRNYRVLLAPDSKVYHQHRATTRRVFGDRQIDLWTRANTLLMHWANLRDPGLLARHLVNLPRIAARDVDRHGGMGLRSLARALRHAPKALSRRLRQRGEGPSDEKILAGTASLLDPEGWSARQPKRLRPDGPLRIVMLTPYQFYPVQHGGGTLIYSLLAELARRGHQMSVVGFVESEEWVEAAAPLRELCREVRLLVRPQRALPPERLRVAPAAAVCFEHPELRAALEDVVLRQDADVVQVEYAQLASFAQPTRRAIMCITEHDVGFVSRYRHAAMTQGVAARAKEYAEYLRTFHHELQNLRHFDVVFPVTPNDGALLRRYLGPSVHVSDSPRTGIDVTRFSHLVRRPRPSSLLFVGFFPHPPNTDAILYFAREILPIIHLRDPEVRLTIVGADPPDAVRRLADDRRVKVTGFVDDLTPYYAQATLFVAPIRVGAGVRIKILEAFAAGIPVISTSVGAEGLDVRNGRELLLADHPQAFAAKTVALLHDPPLQKRMAASARSFVEERYAWPAVATAMEAEYRAALRRKGLMEPE